MMTFLSACQGIKRRLLNPNRLHRGPGPGGVTTVPLLVCLILMLPACATRKSSSEGGAAFQGGGAVVQAASPRGNVAVQLPGSGGWRALGEGELLTEGARIRTAEDGSVDLVFTANGSRFHLDPESVLTLQRLALRGEGDPTAVNVLLALEAGQVSGRMVSQTVPSLFEIVTPQGGRLFYRPESGSTMELALSLAGPLDNQGLGWNGMRPGTLADAARPTTQLLTQRYPSPAATIPEPRSIALLALGILLVARSAARRTR